MELGIKAWGRNLLAPPWMCLCHARQSSVFRDFPVAAAKGACLGSPGLKGWGFFGAIQHGSRQCALELLCNPHGFLGARLERICYHLVDKCMLARGWVMLLTTRAQHAEAVAVKSTPKSQTFVARWLGSMHMLLSFPFPLQVLLCAGCVLDADG